MSGFQTSKMFKKKSLTLSDINSWFALLTFPAHLVINILSKVRNESLAGEQNASSTCSFP